MLRERLTDFYLSILLAVFPLFFGFSGYENITQSKYAFLLSATAVWLLSLTAVSLRRRPAPPRLRAPQWAALCFAGAAGVSWLLSPWRTACFLGAGRYDGALTLGCYVLIFLGVSACTCPKRRHADALAFGVTCCCGVGALQLFGLDPLHLFPGDLTYYDNGIQYSGVYNGTLGNTNIQDAYLCLALPIFFGLFTAGRGGRYLLPIALGSFVQSRTGGSGALVAYAVCALCAGPLLFSEVSRLRRGLGAGGTALLAAAAAAFYAPDYTDRALTPRFAPAPAGLLLLCCAAACICAALLPIWRVSLPKRRLRQVFLGLDAAAVLGTLGAVWFWPGQSGTVYELSRVLHGEILDSFGSSRILIWRNCLALVRARPLTGGGPGTLPLRLDIQFSRYVPETGRTLYAFVDNAHNIYLGYLVNCGVSGLAAYLALLGLTGRAARKRRDANMTAPLLLGGISGTIHGLFGLGLCISEPFFWVALALLCGRGAGSLSGTDGGTSLEEAETR